MSDRIDEMKVIALNAENLFLYLDSYEDQNLENMSEAQWQKLSISTFGNKPLKKVKWLARTILELSPDIVMMSEVGGLESLQNFSRLFLQNEFEALLLEGNSQRGIDLGYLVKRSHGWSCELVSHRERSINFLYPFERDSLASGYHRVFGKPIVPHKFSRDVLQLTCRKPNQSRPHLVAFLVHLKSKLDSTKIDPGGRDRREAEFKMALEIASEVRSLWGPEPLYVFGGDLNGQIAGPRAEPEFAPLADTDWVDVLEIAARGDLERCTYAHVGIRRPTLYRQIDYILIPKSWGLKIISEETFVERYRDDQGRPLPLPRSMEQKLILPSDHYPVVATFSDDIQEN